MLCNGIFLSLHREKWDIFCELRKKYTYSFLIKEMKIYDVQLIHIKHSYNYYDFPLQQTSESKLSLNFIHA